jgi:hypothetical protein
VVAAKAAIAAGFNFKSNFATAGTTYGKLPFFVAIKVNG